MEKEIKILIADESRETRRKTAEALSLMGKFKIMEAGDGEETLSKIKEFRPNVVIIDIWMPIVETATVIKRTKSTNDKSRKTSFIVTSQINNPSMFAELGEAGAEYCAVKPLDIELLRERIMRLIHPDIEERPTFVNLNKKQGIQTDDMETQITKVLHKVGVPAHIKGYNYLRSAIMLATIDNKNIDAVTKMLYPTVARQFETTSSRVERAIRHAIEVAWDRGDLEIINRFFGYTVQNNRGKPTNSEFIALISDNLRLENRIS